MQNKNYNPLDYPISIEEEWDYFQQKKIEDRELKKSDWFANISTKEAQLISSDKSREFCSNLIQIYSEWLRDCKELQTSAYSLEFKKLKKYFVQCFYLQKIQITVTRLIKLVHRYKKHNYLTQPRDKTKDSHQSWIGQAEIDEANDRSIVDLFRNDGHNLLRVGKNYKCLCPFHDDNTPSCTLFISQNNFYCFGCQVSGDPIEYVRKTRRLGFPEAVRYLKRQF